MSLEDGWAWVDGDDWRIDFLGRWSALGVDEGEFSVGAIDGNI